MHTTAISAGVYGALYDVSPAETMSEALALAEGAADRPGPARHTQRRRRLLDSVAAAREKAPQIPVILMSASPPRSWRHLPATEFLPKPFGLAQLIDLIQRHVGPPGAK